MEILPNIEMIGLAIKTGKTLVFGDVHIGYEEGLTEQGILLPKTHFKETIERLENILTKAGKLQQIIINGDLTDDFGKILDEEWRNTLKLIDFLAQHGKVVLIKGNHDTYLKPIADKRDIEIANHIIINDVLITHGDQEVEIPKNIKTIIVGHEHPAVSLKQGAQIETFKCFLLGKYKRKNLIVMPSFNPLTEGQNILTEKRVGPFLPKNVNNFRLFVIEDKAYDFGKVKNLT